MASCSISENLNISLENNGLWSLNAHSNGQIQNHDVSRKEKNGKKKQKIRKRKAPTNIKTKEELEETDLLAMMETFASKPARSLTSRFSRGYHGEDAARCSVTPTHEGTTTNAKTHHHPLSRCRCGDLRRLHLRFHGFPQRQALRRS